MARFLAAAIFAVLFTGSAQAGCNAIFPSLACAKAGLALGPKPHASCGWYMRQQFGGRYGAEFNRARAWARLPRTSLQPGAVVVSSRKGRGCGGPCGHVVKVVRVIDQCRAIVHDNRGTYERNTCRNRVAVVMP